jgi:putative phosphoesterase
VKLGLLADIHCNLPGLERALELLEDCDELLCAGDLLYQFRFSNEVLELLKRRRVLCIVGNHDKTILYSAGHPLRGSPSIKPRNLKYLAGLPSELRLTLDGMRVAMFHGAPWDEVDGPNAHYIYPDDWHSLNRLASVEADVIVLGHTHMPFHRRVGQTLVVNPGSCGESRDGTGTLSCTMLDLEAGGLELRRFTLDPPAAASGKP